MRPLSIAALAGYLFLGLFLVVPLAFLFLQVARGIAQVADLIGSEFYFNLRPDLSRAVYLQGDVLVVRGVDMGVVLNSLWVGLTVAAVDTLLGLLLAYVLAKYSFPGRTVLGLVATLPLISVPFATAYVVKKFLDYPWGTLNWLLEQLGFPYRLQITGLAAVVLVQILAFLPVAYLNIYAAIARVDPTLEEVANNLGASGAKAARHVVFPLATPGIAAAFVLVFIFSIDDVGTPLIFQDPLSRSLMAYQVYSNFLEQTRGTVSPMAAFLALVLLAISTASFLAVRRYVGLRSYAMLIRQLRPREYRPGPLGYLAAAAAFLPALAAVGPLAGAVALAFARSWGAGPLPEGLSIRNAVEMLRYVSSDPSMLRGVANTVWYGLAATGLGLLAGLLIALAAARLRGPAAEALDALATLPLAVPGIVVAYSYFLFALALSDAAAVVGLKELLDPLNRPEPYMVVGYAVRKLPFVVRPIYAGLLQIHPSMEEVSLNLGSGYGGTVRRILVPLLRPNLLTGALMGFVFVTSEVSLSITLGTLRGVGPGTAMPITAIMEERFVGGIYGVQEAAALGLVLVAIQVAAILVTTRVLKARYGFVL